MKKLSLYFALAAVIVAAPITISACRILEKSPVKPDVAFSKSASSTNNIVNTPAKASVDRLATTSSVDQLKQMSRRDSSTLNLIDIDRDAQRAAAILQQEHPSTKDLQWMESLSAERREILIRHMRPARSVPELRNLSLNSQSGVPSVVAANWQHEFIEKQNGGGIGCYANAFWNSPSGQCGKPGEFPPDKVYSFPCSNLAGKSRMRIYSSNWQVNWVLGSGVDARVYVDHVEICVGYWTLYFTGTNPYKLLGTTYIYW